MTKKIYIKEVRPIKSGVKNGKSWQLFHVIDQENVRYTTFEGKYQSQVGQEIDIVYEEKPSDKINPNTKQPYLNRTIIEPKRSIDVSAFKKEVFDRLEELEARVMGIELKMNEGKVIEEEPTPDLPF